MHRLVPGAVEQNFLEVSDVLREDLIEHHDQIRAGHFLIPADQRLARIAGFVPSTEKWGAGLGYRLIPTACRKLFGLPLRALFPCSRAC